MDTSVRRLRAYLLRHRRAYLAGFALSLVSTALSLMHPWVLRLAVDGIRGGVTSRQLVGLALAYVGVAVAGGAVRFFWRMRLLGAGRTIEYEIRNDYFAHLQRLPVAFFQLARTGDLMARATNDLNAVSRLVGVGVMYGFHTVVMFAAAGAFMFTIDTPLALMVVAVLPLVSVVFLVLGRRVHHHSERLQAQFSTLSALAQENFSGIRVVKAFAQEQAQLHAFAAAGREYVARALRLSRTSGALWPAMTLILGIAAALVLWQGGVAVVVGRITLGQMVQFFGYLMMLSWPMIALGWVANIVQQGLASMRRIDEILSLRPAITSPPAARTPEVRRGEVEFRKVSFAYDGRAPVLRDISLVIPAGATVAVVGPTGAGKSTLVSLIPRLWDPTDGAVLVDGVDARAWDLQALRRAIGFVPQDPFLFSDTLEENLRFGLDGDPPGSAGAGASAGTGDDAGGGDGAGTGGGPGAGNGAGVRRAAEIAGLAQEIAGFPHGYATMVGERGVTLSGGQKQRATLARALARDPAILILDDALSSVDAATEEQILRALRDFAAGRTTLIISHRISTVRHADLIVVMDDGTIVEQGTHENLLARGGLYADLYRRQLLREALEAAGETVEASGATAEGPPGGGRPERP
ncbi:MAG: ABC transporter ATP-binding protein [Armatimonadota bacterium]|nr:ABC transporter ATP-binding protein [Armatimonadota bacterium]MDR7485444.1 ABC transporter ATP-binding protein [Armatimonadota bacterium]MDR7534373.1 ABC transporter ATP-binding protein [Armatimonadota bacterium]MDR7536838.1 ABC transporter ATP-binding protein [Armatimonadota bacterium]